MHATDLGNGLFAAFDGFRLVITAPAGMQRLMISPEQWASLCRHVESLEDGLFETPEAPPTRNVCPRCHIEDPL